MNSVVELEFQTTVQRTRASFSCPEEEDDDVAGPVYWPCQPKF